MKKTSINNNYGIHHEALELPNGRLLLAVGKRDSRILLDGEEIWSDSDWIVLFDREKSRIIKEWDLAKHLDVGRDDLNFFKKGDWLHTNGFVFNPDDLSLIISNKNQGLAKLYLSDKLQWILSPKKNWGKAGRRSEGPDTKPYLLTAVDTDENPYPEEVQLGDKSAPDFDFAWGNHAPLIMPNGNLMVFDNGARRNFQNTASYSRAVEYEIDTTNMTVKQVWQYGKERGVEFFSAIVSDVDYLAETGNILLTSGFLNPGRNTKGKIVEIDYSSKEVLFEATLNFKTLNGNGQMAWGQTDILYRSDRLELFQ
jgi:arylsulfate sulfotransferase